jgi:hypothetical protein
MQAVFIYCLKFTNHGKLALLFWLSNSHPEIKRQPLERDAIGFYDYYQLTENYFG